MAREMTGEELARYVPVHERLQEFWAKHEAGAVVTEVQESTPDRVRVKALVYASGEADALPLGTGHAEENRVGEVNAFAAVENCETSAVGRALAMAGFKIDRGMASQQEIQKVKRQQAQKTAEPVTTAEPPAASGPTLMDDEAIALRDQLKATGVEWSAIKLKLWQMGVGNANSAPLDALRTLTPAQGMELLAWTRQEETAAPAVV